MPYQLAMPDWKYLDEKDTAVQELENRIAEAGRREETISYSAIANGITFRLQTGRAHQITEWTEQDRAIIGEYLSFISKRSQKKHNFMASVLVIGQGESMPSPAFFKLAKEVGPIKDTKPLTCLTFAAEEMVKAHEYFKSNQSL